MRHLLIPLAKEVQLTRKLGYSRRNLMAARRLSCTRLLLPGTEGFPPSFQANILLAVYSMTSHSRLLQPFHPNEPQGNQAQTTFAHELWTRIRYEFPELRIYRVWDKPIGPHPVGMFEVNVFTPAQFGAFVAWLVVHRGPLSALVHSNTNNDEVSTFIFTIFWNSNRGILLMRIS